jgi:dipeptidyl aminopeptidase/acylaminoacyl peptidase
MLHVPSRHSYYRNRGPFSAPGLPLLIHGDDDRNVPFSESVTLAAALRAQGVHCEQLIFPDEVHGFLRHANWLRAFRAAAEFFDRQLAGK